MKPATRANGSGEALQTKIVGKLRPSQIITTFGPGAVVDLPDDSVMLLGIDSWPPGAISLHEPRLEEALGVEGFRPPTARKQGGDVPCVRFPKYQVCSKCGLLSWAWKCPECKKDSYPARLIVICPQGHADEFPWSWWVHRGKACVGKPVLRLRNQGRTAALADLIVQCDTCKQSHSLSGALGPRALEGFTCSGKQPWISDASQVDCAAKPRSVLRGASNVYFSSLLSALSIPPWSSPIQMALNNHWYTLTALPENTLRLVIPELEDLAGFDVNLVIEAIKQRQGAITTMSSLRQDEYMAFCNPGTDINHLAFQIRREPVPLLFAGSIKQVILAFRLREVRVLRGFTRVDPPDEENSDQQIAPLSGTPQKWLPAVEHHGEGIFIELSPDRVVEWEARPAVRERVNQLNQAYAAWRQQRSLPLAPPLRPRMVLVHTLAHLFIRQLSLDCGYSSASLRERLYAGPDMCGLLIYTASADSDGSLGGLVQQGQKSRFDITLQALLEGAQWCSSDPLCAEHNPLLTGRLNGASCHACGLVAETSCELSNRLLDRALIRDLPEVTGAGYFSS